MAVRGMAELLTRLSAIKPDRRLMRDLALSAVREQKLLVPRRTGNLGRSIRVGAVDDRHAETVAGAHYARFVELGTKPHLIKPKKAKVLAFPADSSSATLAGRVRKGGKIRFARRVKHPGTKAQPFMLPGARRALEGAGLADVVVKRWNDAA